jgi:hypothetical protein
VQEARAEGGTSGRGDRWIEQTEPPFGRTLADQVQEWGGSDFSRITDAYQMYGIGLGCNGLCNRRALDHNGA